MTFLRQLFARLLKAEIGSSSVIPSAYRDHFLRIRILDSTTFQVPDSLTEPYPGAGGCGHTAGDGTTYLHLEQTGFEKEDQAFNGAKYGWVKMGGELEKVLAEL